MEPTINRPRTKKHDSLTSCVRHYIFHPKPALLQTRLKSITDLKTITSTTMFSFLASFYKKYQAHRSNNHAMAQISTLVSRHRVPTFHS